MHWNQNTKRGAPFNNHVSVKACPCWDLLQVLATSHTTYLIVDTSSFALMTRSRRSFTSDSMMIRPASFVCQLLNFTWSSSIVCLWQSIVEVYSARSIVSSISRPAASRSRFSSSSLNLCFNISTIVSDASLSPPCIFFSAGGGMSGCLSVWPACASRVCSPRCHWLAPDELDLVYPSLAACGRVLAFRESGLEVLRPRNLAQRPWWYFPCDPGLAPACLCDEVALGIACACACALLPWVHTAQSADIITALLHQPFFCRWAKKDGTMGREVRVSPRSYHGHARLPTHPTMNSHWMSKSISSTRHTSLSPPHVWLEIDVCCVVRSPPICLVRITLIQLRHLCLPNQLQIPPCLTRARLCATTILRGSPSA
jgi:hypothetical protein